MEQMYRIANQLGFTSNREDFAGMFKGHLAHYAEGILTVPNAGVAEKLNQMAGEQGLGVTFSSGDRVRMAWKDGEDGNPQVSLFRGEAGGSREALDLSKSTRGIQEWSGQESQSKNLVSASGVIGIGQPGIFNARTFAGLLKDSGASGVASSLAKDIGKGRQVSLESATLDPQSGKLAAFQLRRGGSNTVEDYSRTQTGWESRTTALESVESGLRRHTGAIDVKHDESRSTLERGPVTSPSSMWSAAVGGDQVIGQRVLAAPTNAQRSQEMQEQAVKFAEAQADRLSKQGVLISESSYGAEGGFKLFGAGASAGISGVNREQENYNRVYRDIRTAQDSLTSRLDKGEIKGKEFVGQYTKTFQNYAAESDRLIREKGDEKFGASGMATRPLGSDKAGDVLIKGAKGAKDWSGAWGKGLIEDLTKGKKD
jgi:hypothetical protein